MLFIPSLLVEHPQCWVMQGSGDTEVNKTKALPWNNL